MTESGTLGSTVEAYTMHWPHLAALSSVESNLNYILYKTNIVSPSLCWSDLSEWQVEWYAHVNIQVQPRKCRVRYWGRQTAIGPEHS